MQRDSPVALKADFRAWTARQNVLTAECCHGNSADRGETFQRFGVRLLRGKNRLTPRIALASAAALALARVIARYLTSRTISTRFYLFRHERRNNNS